MPLLLNNGRCVSMALSKHHYAVLLLFLLTAAAPAHRGRGYWY